MNDWKSPITLATCCCIVLTIAPSSAADFVGFTTVIKHDPDIEFLCTQGNGFFVPGPLTVCNVFAAFDNPENQLLSVGNADLQVYNGATPDVFYQHPLLDVAASPRAPMCDQINDPLFGFPDLICDSFITIGVKCGLADPADGTRTDSDFDFDEFTVNGHVVGGWFDSSAAGGFQGVAGEYPDLQVLILQSSVAQGLSLSGTIDIFWWDEFGGPTYGSLDVPIECVATCGSCPTDTDGSGGTEAFDLAILLGAWGPVTPDSACLDADENGFIEAFDLAVLLGNWGPCL